MGRKRLAGTKRLVAAAALAMGVGIGVVAQAAPALADSYSPSAASQFVADINALRAAHGLGALSLNNSLVSMADNWAVHLAGVGSLSHNPSLASEAPSGWRLLGENVGVGPDVASLQAAFTASPEHYANMVDGAFSQIGVGVYVSSQGYMWVTEDYMEPPAVVPAAVPATPVRSAAAPAPATVSVRPVSLSLPAPAPAPAPVAAATPAAAPAASVPHPAAAPGPAPVANTAAAVAPAPPAPLGGPASVRAKLGLMPAQSASLAVPPPAHHASAMTGLAQLIPAAANFAAHAQAPALLLIPLAGMAWLLPRRRPGLAPRGRISTV